MKLVKYVKKGIHNKKVGVVVATGKYNIGYSLCNKLDKFNKERALEIATGRAKVHDFQGEVPDSIKDTFFEMQDRASHYFKVPVMKKDS